MLKQLLKYEFKATKSLYYGLYLALALLSASSALCLRIMKKVDEKLRREKEKRTRK